MTEELRLDLMPLEVHLLVQDLRQELAEQHRSGPKPVHCLQEAPHSALLTEGVRWIHEGLGGALRVRERRAEVADLHRVVIDDGVEE
eukprot:2709825-Alexandrium_andersonii.AAC.1